MHFRHILGKIKPKNLKLVYYLFLAMRFDWGEGYALFRYALGTGEKMM